VASVILLAKRPNLIYGVHPDCWDTGFATEAAKAVVDFAFNTFQYRPIVRAVVSMTAGSGSWRGVETKGATEG
jgi:Acetyltransferase (GNAT) domain